MPHGAPDWYKYRRESVTYPVDDLAELAVRLGSIVAFDRRGDVVFMESFEHGLLRVFTSTSGTGASIILDPTVAKTGGYSAKMTAGKDDDHAAQMQIILPTPLLPTVGIEFSFSRCKADTQIQLTSSLYSAIGVLGAMIRYYPGTNTLEYRDSDNNMQTLDADLHLHDADHFFHTLKLVVDFNTRMYTRFFADHNIYDLSTYALRLSGAPSHPLYYSTIQILDTADANPYIYVDDIIATQDER